MRISTLSAFIIALVAAHGTPALAFECTPTPFGGVRDAGLLWQRINEHYLLTDPAFKAKYPQMQLDWFVDHGTPPGTSWNAAPCQSGDKKLDPIDAGTNTGSWTCTQIVETRYCSKLAPNQTDYSTKQKEYDDCSRQVDLYTNIGKKLGANEQLVHIQKMDAWGGSPTMNWGPVSYTCVAPKPVDTTTTTTPTTVTPTNSGTSWALDVVPPDAGAYSRDGSRFGLNQSDDLTTTR